MAKLLSKFGLRIFVIGSPVCLSGQKRFSISFTKQDRIGFTNYPNAETIEKFLKNHNVDKLLEYCATFFSEIECVQEKLRLAYASTNSLAKIGMIGFFLENEVNSDNEKIFLFDCSMLSFVTTNYSLLNKKIHHVYSPFRDITKLVSLAYRYALIKIRYLILIRGRVSRRCGHNADKIEKNEIAIFFHQGQNYGELYRKDQYYSLDPKSMLHESKIQKIAYEADENYNDPELRYLRPKIAAGDIVKTLKNVPIKLLCTSPSIRLFKDTLIIFSIYLAYLGWRNVIPQLGIRGAIYDYDILFPKPLSLALESLNIKTCCLQERPVTLFYNFYFGVIVDTYLFSGEYYKKYALSKKGLICSKSDITFRPWRNVFFDDFSGGLHGRDISLLDHDSPEIANKIVFLGYRLDETDSSPVTCTRANEEFIKYAVVCAQRFPSLNVVIRMKTLTSRFLDWCSERVSGCSNISISTDYSSPGLTYKICRDAALVVSLQSSIVEECVIYGKKVILIDNLFTVKNLCSGVYPPDFFFMIVSSLHEFVRVMERHIADAHFLDHNYSELRQKLSGDVLVGNYESVPKILERVFASS